jgi:hypothetical protein
MSSLRHLSLTLVLSPKCLSHNGGGERGREREREEEREGEREGERE